MLLGRGQARVERQDLGVPEVALGQRVRGVADLALAGQEHQDVARALALQLGDGVADGLDLVAVGVGLGVVGVHDRPVAQLDGIRAAGDLDDRHGGAEGVREVPGEALGVDRRGGDDDLEVRAPGEQLREVAQDEVDVEAALVGLVDDQGVVAREVPVAGQLGEQDAVRHQLDQGVLADLVGEADLVAHDPGSTVAQLGAQLLGDAVGDRARGEPSRLGVADHAGDAAAQVETDLGDLRGLTRAGLAGDDHDLVVADRRGDVVAAGADGQRGGIGDAGDGGAPGRQPGLGGVDRTDQGRERACAVGLRPGALGGVEPAAQALRLVRAQGGDALAEGGGVEVRGCARGSGGGVVGSDAAREGRGVGGGNAGRGLVRGVVGGGAPPAAAAPTRTTRGTVDRGGGPGAAVVVRARAGGGGVHR